MGSPPIFIEEKKTKIATLKAKGKRGACGEN